jgi:hypothetical protein
MAQGTGTTQLGKRKESSESADINTTRENLLFEVYRETQDQESRGFLGPAMTKEQLIASHTVKGVFLARPLPRFGINQGFKLNSEGAWVMKTSCIDDAKRAGVNTGTLMGESLVMPTFDFIARAGAYVCEKSDNSPEFDLLLGLEDMFAAYRRFDNSSVHVSVVAVFNPHNRELHGLSMGNSSSTGHFYRVPEALSAVDQMFCAVAGNGWEIRFTN